MPHLLPTMLFAATATAQVTTSFWMPSFALGAEHIGFVGSVVNANETHTTIVVDYDNGTDTSALSLGGGPETMTIGPTVFGIDVSLGVGGGSLNDESSYNYYCEWPTPEEADSNRTCTVSYPPELASLVFCEANVFPSTTETAWTVTHTYPARGSEPAGTETVERTFSVGYGSGTVSNTAEPSFCNEISSGQEPEEGYSTEAELPATSIETYYLVITAGTEKLEATEAATPTMSSAMSTGTGDADATTASGTAPSPEATEAGAPMVTGAPMLIGLGAAAVALLV